MPVKTHIYQQSDVSLKDLRRLDFPHKMYACTHQRNPSISPALASTAYRKRNQNQGNGDGITRNNVNR